MISTNLRAVLFVDEDGESHPSPLSSQSLGTYFDNNGFEIYIAQPRATGCAVTGCAVCVDEDGNSHTSPSSSQSCVLLMKMDLIYSQDRIASVLSPNSKTKFKIWI